MRDRHIQNPVNDLRWNALEKLLWFLTIFAKKLNARVLNMRRDAIMEGFWIFLYSKYARFLRMQVLYKVLNMPEYG